MACIEARELRAGMIARRVGPLADPQPFRLVDRVVEQSCYAAIQMLVYWAAERPVRYPADTRFEVLDDHLTKAAS
jgi:hypothetical protein